MSHTPLQSPDLYDEAVRHRVCDPPSWLETLRRAFSRPTLAQQPAPFWSDFGQGDQTAGFLDMIAPLILDGRERLGQGIQRLAEGNATLPFDPETIEGMLVGPLPRRLLGMLGRVMVLELNVARLEGRLAGESAADRYQSFIERIRGHDVALAILGEYPMLARQIVTAIEQWVDSSLEFLTRLCEDWETIRAGFGPDIQIGMLAAVDGGAGDSHRGGRSVLIARFSSGFRVVYKPRSVAVDRHFQDLLTWINARGTHPPFRTLTVLDRGPYGWIEFVAAEGCHTAAEVRRFYRRQGGFLAILFALSATDFHFENLIAAGEHPVLVDLEALFHPRIGTSGLALADQIAQTMIADSALGVGLLPHRSWSGAESAGIDISGLGAVDGQITPMAVPYWEAAGTDAMHLNRKRIAIGGGQHRPALDGVPVDTLDYVDDLIAGFDALYSTFVAHRDTLLADDGPLAPFATDETRAIIRPTHSYSRLLQDSYHPDVLRRASDRDRLLDRLCSAAAATPCLTRIIPAERADLSRGDIPIFTCRPEARDLWTSTGERVPDLFEESGMERAVTRMRRLGEQDLARQEWIIRASLATAVTGKERLRTPTYRLDPAARAIDPAHLLSAASTIGDRLVALAHQSEHGASWLGMRLEHGGHLSLVPLGIELYDGLCGVALYLAYLGAATGESRFTALARAALASIRHQIERDGPSVSAIGAFDGWGGVIYMLSHLASLWNEPALLDEATAIVARIPPLVERDAEYDIIGGAAGCISALLSLHNCSPSSHTLDVASHCGTHLVSAYARAVEQGSPWIPGVTGQRPLAGFAHGAAGIATALLDLAALTGQDGFRKAALGGIAYERRIFSHEAGNWPDLRVLDPEDAERQAEAPTFMTAWCQGAPGIGLARIQALRHLDDTAIRQEIQIAVRTTFADGFGRNHTLCHGDLGNIEVLVQAAHALDEPCWHRQALRLAAAIVESFDREGWRCGSPTGIETPGLMTGLAGIGYGLLRLAEPARVPSVLTLATPLQGERSRR